MFAKLTIGWPNNSAAVQFLFQDKFSGKISDFNVWNRSLTNDEMKRFTSKCDQSIFTQTSQSVIWSNLRFPINSSSIKVSILPTLYMLFFTRVLFEVSLVLTGSIFW